ncbi:phosphoglycerate mutase-like protein [Xylariaceae sp. FL1019]|nr:phosphoglycerate mutase-like protein [Xylariaceae sp. FL1019]
MAPIIHLVRHAQGYHNLSLESQWIKDPDLTELGEQQCADLCKAFPYHDKITHLVASPIRRTLFTCKLSFAPAVESGKKILALPDAQEVSLYPCDVGSDVDTLKNEFGDLVDLHLVQSNWNIKSPESKYYPDPMKLEARARDARLALQEIANKADSDAHIVLVTHGGILHFLTEDWQGIAIGRGTAWENTEYRSYQFVDKTGADPNATLEELPESRSRRKGTETRVTKAEQRSMRAAYESALNSDLQEVTKSIAEKEGKGKLPN